MAELTGDKSHEPTPHRRQQAREQGQVARSRDVSSALLLCGAVVALLWLGGSVVEFLGNLTTRQLGGEPWLTADVSFASGTWNGLLSSLSVVLLPILGLVMLLAIAGNVLQVGLIFLPAKALPDFSRIDPWQGFARLASLGSLGRLAFGFLKVIAVAIVAWYCLASERERILNCGHLSVADLAIFTAEILVWTTLKIGVALLALAGVDYGYERWRHERDLRMTAQEIREEMRNLQGDPQVMARRRAWQRQPHASGQVGNVASADILIIDGQGLAVAVRYDAQSMAAPLVVAKGIGQSASKMCSLAAARHVPSATQQALARSLYEGVALNRPVPRQFYRDLAELLTTAKADGEAAGAHSLAAQATS